MDSFLQMGAARHVDKVALETGLVLPLLVRHPALLFSGLQQICLLLLVWLETNVLFSDKVGMRCVTT